MISRYQVKEVSDLWDEEYKFKKFLQVELAIMQVLEKHQVIPKGQTQKFKKVKIDVNKIHEIEKTTRHDVLAFCQSISEQLDAANSKYFHYGVTSSDIIDTAQSLIIKENLELVITSLKQVIEQLRLKVVQTKKILCLGRSHGMNAEPMIFAQKFLSFQREFERRLVDYQHLMQHEVTGKISGAVGNYTILSPTIEQEILENLKLKTEPVSSQIVPRDHLALILAIGSLAATAIERCALELRLLHHSDVSEVSEGFKPGQKGSSTMPHKKNPISSENLTGIARVLRSHYEVGLQNCLLWHERDISHSSAERLMLPDHFGLLVYALRRLSNTLENLEVHQEKIESKVENNFNYLSSYLLHQMINSNHQTSRERLYTLLQQTIFKANNENDFWILLQQNCKKERITAPKKISIAQLKKHYQQQFEQILKRC